jgi:EpsI family protein
MPLLALYIIWKKREFLVTTPVEPKRSGSILILAGILLYVAGQAAQVNTAQQLSFFIIIPGIILSYFGYNMLKRMLIPLIILAFMTPWAELFSSHLEIFVARLTAEILFLLNTPIFIESNYIQLPHLTVRVIDECSGIRFLTALVPIGLTIAYLHLDSHWKKVTMLLFSLLLSVLANLFRIASMLLLAARGNPILVYGIPHKIYGYSVFLGALLVLFVFGNFLMRFQSKPTPSKRQSTTNTKPLDQSLTKGFASYRNLVLVGVMILIPALVQGRLLTQPITPLVQDFKSFPNVLGEWKGRELTKHEWHSQIVGAKNELQRVYRDPQGNLIKVSVSYLPIQTQGQELVYHANKIIPPGFRIMRQSPKTWSAVGNPSTLNLKTKDIRLTNRTSQVHLLVWYQNTNRYADNEYKAKAFMALDSLLKNRSNGAVFVLMYKSPSLNANDQDMRIQDFLNHFMDEIRKYVPS